MDVYLGIDVGSVTTKLAALDADKGLMTSLYISTGGRPVAAVQEGLRGMKRRLPAEARIRGVATTGSARYLAWAIVGADLVKNEITCQALATIHRIPGVQTIIEIGGQDSKMIIVREGMVVDFGMNTVCAAGTGSFLDHQASRLNMSIGELSRLALLAEAPVGIAGRCTVFAESDMVHKQQSGHRLADIVYGLCRALVRNYLSDVGAGKDVRPPVVFQGGVAFNKGMVRAFEEELEADIIVPPHHEVMGAIGAARLASEQTAGTREKSRFKGFSVGEVEYRASSFECQACPTACEISRIAVDDRIVACWGGQCDMWEDKIMDQVVN